MMYLTLEPILKSAQVYQNRRLLYAGCVRPSLSSDPVWSDSKWNGRKMLKIDLDVSDFSQIWTVVGYMYGHSVLNFFWSYLQQYDIYTVSNILKIQ